MTKTMHVIAGAALGFFIGNTLSDNWENDAWRGYQVQKDARELAIKVFSDEDFKLVLQGSKSWDTRTTQLLWLGFNFESSIYRLSVNHALPNETVESVKVDFCDWLKDPVISTKWDAMLLAKQIGPIHVEMREEWCDEAKSYAERRS